MKKFIFAFLICCLSYFIVAYNPGYNEGNGGGGSFIGDLDDVADGTDYVKQSAYLKEPQAFENALARGVGVEHVDSLSKTLSLSNGYVHGSLFIKGYLYLSTRESPASLIKVDPDDLTVEDTLTFASDGNHLYADSICYDNTNDCIYVLFGVSGKTVVDKVNYTEMTTENLILNTTYDSNTTPAIETDGTYIYIISNELASYIRKFNCSDGAFVAEQTDTDLDSGHAITYDGTNLYATGSDESSPVLAKINPSTLAITTGSLSGSKPTDDLVSVGDYIYIGFEDSTGILSKVKKSDLSEERISTFISQTVYAMHYDGRYIWIGYDAGSYITMYDPECCVLKNIPIATTSSNEIISDGKRVFYTHWDATASVGRLSIHNTTGNVYYLGGLYEIHKTLMEPDKIQGVSDSVPLFQVDSIKFPLGIIVEKIRLAISSATTLAINVEEWSDPSTNVATIDNISTSSATEAEETTISDPNVATGSYVMADLDTTDVNWAEISIWFRDASK